MKRVRHEVQNDNQLGLPVLPGGASPCVCLPCTMLGSGPAPPSVGTGAGRHGRGSFLKLLPDSGCLSLSQSNLCFGKFLIFLFGLADILGRECFQEVPLEFSYVKEFVIVE